MTAATDVSQKFVQFVVEHLVDYPDQVRTEVTVDEMGVLVTLYTHPADMGKVIGRSGNTAKALRTLLRVVGAKHKARVNLRIFEPEGSGRGFDRHQADSSDNGGMTSGHAPVNQPADDEFDI